MMRGNERKVVSWIKLRMWAVVIGLPALAAVGTPSAPNCTGSVSKKKRVANADRSHLEDQVGKEQRRGWKDVVRVGSGQVGDPAETAFLQLGQGKVSEAADDAEKGQEDGHLDERKQQGPERVDVVLLHEVAQTLADERLHVGVLVGARDLGLGHQFLDLRVDGGEADAVLLGVDDEAGETEADEDGGACDGGPPVCPTVSRRGSECTCTYQGRPSSVWSATRPSVNQPVTLRMPWS